MPSSWRLDVGESLMRRKTFGRRKHPMHGNGRREPLRDVLVEQSILVQHC
jgi:hypothetical protein